MRTRKKEVAMKNNLSVILRDPSKQPPKVSIAYIQYKNIDGCHVFTSEQIEGLFIATPDSVKALSQLVPTIKTILKLQSNSDYEIELGEEFNLFEPTHCGDVNPIVLDDTCVVIRKVA